MRDSVRALWLDYSAPLEGRVPWMYLDVVGLVTCGVGNLIDPLRLAMRLPWRGPDGYAGAAQVEDEWNRVKAMTPGLLAVRYRGPLYLAGAAIDELVMRQLTANEALLAAEFSEWDQWPADAQLAALSHAWAVGAGWPARWPRLAAACRRRDWFAAGEDCQMHADRNPGIRPRNEAQRTAFRNAAVVSAGNQALTPREVYWPLELDLYCDSRQREKQTSRDVDAHALASGAKSREQLRRENGKVRIARVHWDRVRAPR